MTDLAYLKTQTFLQRWWDNYLMMEADPEAYKPISAIIPEMTYAMGGFGKGMFVVFGARPKGGKSAALLSCVSHIAKVKPDALIGFVSNEMWEDQLGRAFMSNISYVNRGRMKHLELDTGEKDKIERAMRDFGQGINCAWAWNITKFDELRAWISKVEEDHNAPMEYLVIDYIHLMDGEGAGPTQKIPWITRQMKKLTLDFNGMCVISAAQLNNEHIKNKNWSHTAFLYGGVDRDADAGIIIADYEDDTGQEVDGIKVLHLPVVREGEGGLIKAAFRGEYALITGTAPEPIEYPENIADTLEFEW